MSRTVTTLTVSTGVRVAETTTVLLVRMTPAQVREWKWVGDMWAGEDPVCGYEVRDVTGALLGLLLPLGNLGRSIHVEWYDPETGDFYAAGDTNAPVMRQGVARIIDARRWHVGPVPLGEGFTLDQPRYLPTRTACLLGECADGCGPCEGGDGNMRDFWA